MTRGLTMIRPKGTGSSTQVKGSFGGIAQFVHSDNRKGRVCGYRYK